MESEPHSLPIYGTMNAQISFLVIIDIEGNYIRLEDSRKEDGKGKTFVVPLGVHTNAITPFLFWDNCQYALNYSIANKPLSEADAADSKKVTKWKKSLASANKKHEAFVAQCISIAEETQDEKLMAVSKFYANKQLTKLMQSDDWKLIKENPSANVSFCILGDTHIVANTPCLLKYIENDSTEKGVCLITGNRGAIVRKTTPTPIAGCNASASLVSFQEDSGYDSYGKTKAYNAPISIEAEFAFSTAFKRLKETDSKNRFTINDRLYIYFASDKNKETEQIEDFIFNFFGKGDDPNSNIESVRKKFESIFNGKKYAANKTLFYIIGIAPNLGRESIIYYSEIELYKFAKLLDKHFEDMEINAPKYEKPYYGLYEIIRSVSLKGEMKNCPPNLPDAVVKSIFMGYPYPQTLFAAAIRRIRAEQDLTPFNSPCRVAIIKAYLNRLNDNNNKKIQPMLDKENTNEGYLCGRLFAVLDRIQEKANNQHSIQERYMNAASATPAAVFATILNLSNHHAEKLDGGLKIYFEKLKQEIIAGLTADGFPAHLDLQDQGRFFIGFYHQRQDFFTAKEDETVTE